MTALHLAIYDFSDLKSAKLLLEHGADPTLVDRENRRVLDSPLLVRYPVLLEAYLSSKNVQDTIASSPAGLQLLEFAINKNNLDLVKKLLSLGVSVKRLDIKKIADVLEFGIIGGNKKTISILEEVFIHLDTDNQRFLNEIFKKKNIDLPYATAVFGKPKLADKSTEMGDL